MKRYITILPVAAALMMCSCSDSQLETQLDRADAVMLEHPDSALHILSRTRATGSREQNARRALLYSMALDKNYIDITSDSLTSVACDYYRNHGSDRERFLAKFYDACILRNCNDLPGALCKMYDCIESGIESGDHYHLGILYGQISDFYEHQYDFESAMIYARSALEQFKLCGHKSYQAQFLIYIGRALNAMYRYNEATAAYNEALALAEEIRDTGNIDFALGSLAQNYLNNKQIDSAQMMLDRKIPELNDYYTYVIQAHIYRKQGNISQAVSCLDIADEKSYDISGKAIIAHSKSLLYSHQGLYKEALEQRIFFNHVQDSLLRNALRQPISAAHSKHLQMLYNRANNNADLLRQRFWLTITLTIIIAAAVIYYIIYVMRKRRRSARLRYLQSLRTNRQISDLMTQQIDMQTEQVQHMRQLICRCFAPIDRIATTYYERKDSKTAQVGIYRDVERLLDSYVSDSKVKEQLEYSVNIGRNNIMKALREELPQLADKEFDLLLYIYAGFSTSAIALFTDDKPNNIYLRKCRLKNKIAKSDAPSREMFIDNMT